MELFWHTNNASIDMGRGPLIMDERYKLSCVVKCQNMEVLVFSNIGAVISCSSGAPSDTDEGLLNTVDLHNSSIES